jgi:hypothetical protein
LNEYTFEGTVRWAFVTNVNQYGKFSLNLYVDDKTRKAIKATGTKNGLKEDDQGFYYVFRSDEKPVVVDGAGQPVTEIVGDGSKVRIAVTVEKFDSKHGPNARTKLKTVVVDELVPYESKAKVNVPQPEAVDNKPIFKNVALPV